MKHACLVGLGGALGAMCRYAIGHALYRGTAPAGLPWHTIVANLLGCFMIAWLAGMGATRWNISESLRFFLFVGLLGGFTTFSAFGLETMNLIRAQHTALAVSNMAIQVMGGLLAVWLGLLVSRA